MSDDRPVASTFETDVEDALAHIANATPVDAHDEFDPDRLGRPDRVASRSRRSVAVLVGVGVVAVVVAGSIAATQRSGNDTIRSGPATDPSASSIASAPPTSGPPTSVTTTTASVVDRDPIPADFTGLIPANCFVSEPGTAPANAVPLRIDLSDIATPVEDTGVGMGPYDPSTREPRQPPAGDWNAVSDSTSILGYLYEPLDRIPDPADVLDPTCHPEVAIYDANGVLIGSFVDGSPVIVGRDPDGDAATDTAPSGTAVLDGSVPDSGSTERVTEIIDAQQTALKRLTGFSATATVTSADPDGNPSSQTVRYTLLADGSFYAVTGPGTFGSYDPATGIVLGAFRGVDGEVSYQEILGQSNNLLPLGILGGYDPTSIAQAGFDGSPEIEDVEIDSRPAWRLTYEDTYPAHEGTDDVVQTTVQVFDRESGLVVRNSTTTTDPAGSAQSTELTDIEIVDTMPAEFPGAFPVDAEVQRDGDPAGARVATLDDVAGLFGPGVPLPTGFVSGSVVENAAPATIVVAEGPGYLDGEDGRDPPSSTYLSATITTRQGFVATTLEMHAQTIVDGIATPDRYAIVDGFLCRDPDGDGTCAQYTADDENVATIREGALTGLPVYIGVQPGFVTGTVSLGAVNISVTGSDRATVDAILAGFTA